MKNFDCIDASIILETVFEDEERCEQYVNTIGYKLRNKGLLTIPLIGEIFTNLFLKVSESIGNQTERKVMLQTAVDFFDNVIIRLLQQNKLKISKINNNDYKFVKRIKELDYAITDDDALHLSSAINNNCQRFITKDKVLLDKNFKSNVKKEFEIIIAEPN
jgi:predicted nucleic acid-binding protein